jgi:tetratricopeptide (TPR) repeat protein
MGQEAKAVESFSEAIKLRPDWINVYGHKAMTLRSPPLERVSEADACMAQMIAYWEEDPSNKDKKLSVKAHQTYGLWLKEMGEYYRDHLRHDDAIKHFKDALKQTEAVLAMKPDDPGGLYLGGQVDLALGYFPAAEKYARRGIEAAPQDFAMYVLMADICLARTDPPVRPIDERRDAAIQVLKNGVDVIQDQSARAQLLWHLANLYLDSRTYKDGQNIVEAVKCIKRMREYHHSSVEIAFLEARVRYGNGDWNGARKGFEEVRAKLSEFPQLMKCLHYWIGYCYLQQQNPDAAMASFRTALSYDTSYFKARDGVAQIFLADGKFRDAVEEYQQAVRGNPSDAEARLALARTLLVWNLRRSPAERNWNEVKSQLAEAVTLSPRDGQIALLQAEMLLA